MIDSEPYLRMCKECYSKSLIVKDGCNECICPVCDAVHIIKWLPKVYIKTDEIVHEIACGDVLCEDMDRMDVTSAEHIK